MDKKSPFGNLHHVCIVVHDIDTTQAYYESIGIGPWTSYPPLEEYTQLDVPDRNGFLAMQYRVCNLPNIQIQLCQPNDDPTPQRIHLDTKGEGVFHMGFEVPDADAAEAASDLPVLMRGRRENGTGFTYYDTAEKAGVVLLTRETSKPER
ncbi:VOC family protein [Komagataeibacter sp. FNDCF1]|uniref:VOC family protein n=1 Tax=Komagataeibacter sp. FNDCF1 TaxID=2878681 RepID=UPI001E418C46|nr:VOC family protein [Komagataeibacter sp. FNDCF1]MCE2563304.1 VOC family protein [Komagataeibacter sp. FNDCF1]